MGSPELVLLDTPTLFPHTNHLLHRNISWRDLMVQSKVRHSVLSELLVLHLVWIQTCFQCDKPCGCSHRNEVRPCFMKGTKDTIQTVLNSW